MATVTLQLDTLASDARKPKDCLLHWDPAFKYLKTLQERRPSFRMLSLEHVKKPATLPKAKGKQVRFLEKF